MEIAEKVSRAAIESGNMLRAEFVPSVFTTLEASMNRPIHFEIHTDNPERAIAFYSECFGWSFQKWEGGPEYWMVVTGSDDQPGINGGLLPRREPPSGNSIFAYICTIQVEDIDAKSARLLAHGATVALPKMPIPGMGWLAYFKDTEENVFGIMQEDPSAQ
jgi:predicted enzyme related to lactoylglutathione lyase